MITIILTVIITIIAYQLILFIIALANKLDNEKVQIAICGVWSLLWIIFVGGGYAIYKRLRLKWFNKHYSYCTFYDKENSKHNFSAYVKNQDNNALLNFDMSKRYYVRFDYQHKAKNLDGVYLKRNNNQDIINDLLNPPTGFTKDFFKRYMR